MKHMLECKEIVFFINVFFIFMEFFEKKKFRFICRFVLYVI
jgi:hypothetical protein